MQRQCWWAGLAEYRLEAVARLSGVNVRNIRAYRQRGLLDPPRREGRTAYYDDRHLAQLDAISQLLRRGYSSAHIAEFIAGLRDGADLAGMLGIQPAIFGAAPDRSGVVVTGLDAEDVRQLCGRGVAQISGAGAAVVDAAIAPILARAADKRRYVAAIVHLADAAEQVSGELADTVLAGLHPFADGGLEQRSATDYAELADHLIADRLGAAVRQRLATAVAAYEAGADGQVRR